MAAASLLPPRPPRCRSRYAGLTSAGFGPVADGPTE